MKTKHVIATLYAVAVIAMIVSVLMFAYTDKHGWLFVAMVAVPALVLEKRFDDWDYEADLVELGEL